jgi:hypothetical protein
MVLEAIYSLVIIPNVTGWQAQKRSVLLWRNSCLFVKIPVIENRVIKIGSAQKKFCPLLPANAYVRIDRLNCVISNAHTWKFAFYRVHPFSRCSDSLRAGRSGDRIAVLARFSAPVQTGPRWIFRKWEGVVGTGGSWLRTGTGGGHFECGNELSSSIKAKEFRLAAEPVSFSSRTLLQGVSK